MPLHLDVPGNGTPPTRLYRRKSLKLARTPSSGQPNASLGVGEGHALRLVACAKIPMELLEQIVDFYAGDVLTQPDNDDDALDCKRLTFKTFIQPYTLVSRDFRFLILSRFFEHLSFQNTKHSTALFLYLGQVDLGYQTLGCQAGYSWVRSLSTASFLIRFNAGNLKKLTRLQSLTIDFAHSGLLLQTLNLAEMFSLIAVPNIVHCLTAMTLKKFPRIDHHLLTLIATNIPGLIKLHICSIEGLNDCCPSCYENSQSLIVHSPVFDIYPGITALTDAFGASLAPLKNLTHLFIGFFLSQPDLLDLHIPHAKSDTDMEQLFVTAISTCPRCEIHRKATKETELIASLSIARYLESLKYIGWGSCFNDYECPEVGGSRKESAIEGSHDATGTDILYDAPPARQELGAMQVCPSNLSTALVIVRTDEKIRVTRMY